MAQFSEMFSNRYTLRYMTAFSRLATHLLNVCPVKVNVKEWQEMFRVGSYQIMENYFNYLKQAYLLIGVHLYSVTKNGLSVRSVLVVA